MRANPYHPATALGYCAQGACRSFGMCGVTAGEAKRARPCGQRAAQSRPVSSDLSDEGSFIVHGVFDNRCQQGALRSGGYDLTGGVAWCASPCGLLLSGIRVSCSVDRAKVIA